MAVQIRKGSLLRYICLIVIGLLFVRAAGASDPSQLIGKWLEKLPNGASMVMEFAPTSISFYAIDSSGQRAIEPKPQDVTYRDLGDTIAIDFKGGGEIMAMIKDQQSMVLIFPGAGSHPLERMPSQ